MPDLVITPVVHALGSDGTGVGSNPSDVNLMRLVFHAQTTYEYPNVQNVFPSLPQQFMHPSIHHDHAVKRMLYPKPKVLMMFRPLLQSFTCLPPFSVEEAEERGKPTSPFRTVDALKKKPTAPTPDTRLSDSCICAANGWHRRVRNCAWPCSRNTMPAAVVKDGTVTPKFRQGKISPPFLTAKFSPRNSPLAKFSPPLYAFRPRVCNQTPLSNSNFLPPVGPEGPFWAQPAEPPACKRKLDTSVGV